MVFKIDNKIFVFIVESNDAIGFRQMSSKVKLNLMRRRVMDMKQMSSCKKMMKQTEKKNKQKQTNKDNIDNLCPT